MLVGTSQAESSDETIGAPRIIAIQDPGGVGTSLPWDLTPAKGGWCDNSTEVVISPCCRRSWGSGLSVCYCRVAACRPKGILPGSNLASFGQQVVKLPI